MSSLKLTNSNEKFQHFKTFSTQPTKESYHSVESCSVPHPSLDDSYKALHDTSVLTVNA